MMTDAPTSTESPTSTKPPSSTDTPTATVQVRLFARYREAAGTPQITRPVAGPDGRPQTVGALWSALGAEFPALAAIPPAAAVNAVLVRLDHVLAPGDEVAFLPPVSGG